MPKAPTSAPQAVTELVEHFQRNLEQYRSPQYKEAEVRREFIDPFFEALGWDVQNRRKYAEAYKDVVHEPSLDEEGAFSRAPDYSFQPAGHIKFFVEAKKPSVNLDETHSPALQLRRYGWTQQLPISILTNFAEFAVYDCRMEPGPADGASTARVLYYTFDEYAAHWDELVGLFSPDAVFKGSFDRFAETRKRKGVAPFDQRFLNDMEAWRKRLAENLALRNHGLSQPELNYAVQQTIDRILFLRICEARGIEPPERLLGVAKLPDVYPNLVNNFRLADNEYNSGLFHFHQERGRLQPDELTPSLKLDDEVLRVVIGQLYWPARPYAFEVVPADILGQVYERFLGKVIRLTAGHHAKVEEKPEVKKAGGVYYTPTYIVDYIVKNTVGNLLEGKTPKQAGKLRILDPACGSGSFLLGAYDFLLKWYLHAYIAEGPEKHKDRLYPAGGGWKLTIGEKRQILLDNIYGVDIDSQAVEVTKLSLLLKVLEGESEQTAKPRLIKEPALPDLDRNIKCGNSLIGPDFYDDVEVGPIDEQTRHSVNAFDWKTEFFEITKQGSFDAVIGNPPYDVLEKERGASSWPHSALTPYVRLQPAYQAALGGKLNLFRFFLVQSLHLLRHSGRFGMIMPLALLADISCAATRRHLLLSAEETLADCFPQKDNQLRRVFKNAKLSTVVLTCTRAHSTSDKAQIRIRVYPWNSFHDKPRECLVRLKDTALIDPENAPIPLVDEAAWKLCLAIHGRPSVKRLGEIKEIHTTRGEINQTIYRRFISNQPKYTRMLKGVEVGRYHMKTKLSQGEREWFDQKRYLASDGKGHLPLGHRIATQRITGVDEKLRVVAHIILEPAYFADSTNSIVIKDTSPYTRQYLLGILNSRLTQWRFKLTSTNNNVGTNELECLPFRIIDFSKGGDRLYHQQMTRLVDRIMDLHKKAPSAKTDHERTAIRRQIDATDRQIDQLVYQLYGLTKTEIALVESAQAANAH